MSPELHFRKPKTPPDDLIHSKNSLSSLVLSRPCFYQPRTWLLFFILFTLLLFLRTTPSFPHRRHHFSSHNITSTVADNNICRSWRVFVYELPSSFNLQLVKDCDKLNPWNSRCEALQNDGFGPAATGLSSVVPANLASCWFWTDQYVSEIIFHNRMLNHKCRTLEASKATAFYIPFYAGVEVEKFLWLNHTNSDIDNQCQKMLEWVQEQPFYKKSNGWDHFITMGRVTWDFRRLEGETWGSRCIHMHGMRNITRLFHERNPWDYFDVAVPFPTSFHPRTDSDVVQWQQFVRSRNRSSLFCFVGATRRHVKNDFRGLLFNHCMNESDSCRLVDCSATPCYDGTPKIIETFLHSHFCLQPRGDSLTRRSFFDCMIAGSIPVLFWKGTAYSQYKWFLPSESESYSVFIDRNTVKNRTLSIRKVLESYSEKEVKKMREKIIEYMPKFLYARTHHGLESIKDAFDVTIEMLSRRFEKNRSRVLSSEI